MSNGMRDRLVELLKDTLCEWECDVQPETVLQIAEHLVENGVVPAIRCKDCKFYEKVEYYHPTEKASKNVCRLIKRQMQPDDYCSYGERKVNK